MDTLSSNDEKICKRMTRALKIAKKAWEDSEMPDGRDSANENRKIGIPMLAVKIYDKLPLVEE
jgi:hypothetical protein